MAHLAIMCHSVSPIDSGELNHVSQSRESNATGETTALRWGAGERVDDPRRGAARVIAAARQCYAESSVASTTIDQIAQRAGISRRTIYRYFDNKDAILLAVVEDQAEPFLEQMRASLAQQNTREFRQLLIHCVLFAIEHGPRMEGHQLLLGKKNAAATERFYLRSKRMKDTWHELLGGAFDQARQAGDIEATWRLGDLINWMGRLVYSFIQHPESLDSIRRMVREFLLPLPNGKLTLKS